MSWRSAVLFALLCPLALIGGPGGFACFHRNSSISTRAKLVEALGPCRFVEGRLTGGFSYERFDSAHPGLRLSKDRQIALRKLSREVSGSTPEVIADRALFKLIDGDPRQAVQMLEAASAAKPNSAAFLSDLAAARLVEARVHNDPYSLVKALEAAENAVTIEPNLPEARFNRALALESLFLRNQAKSAWDEYLNRDEKSGWAQEARSRKSAANVPDAASRWAFQARKLEEAVAGKDQATVIQIVRDFPQASREYAEEKLLGEWGVAALAQRIPEAQQRLAVARDIGAALVASNGERMVASSVDVIDQSGEQRKGTSLAAGHAQYQEGLRLQGEGKFGEARDRFAIANTSLRRAGSPFADWAVFRLAVSEMQLFQYERSRVLLTGLHQSGFRSLRGRCLWVEGLILAIQGRFAESIAVYHSALQDFTAVRENENLTVVRSLIAECLAALGDFPGAWSFHQDALSLVKDLRNPVRRQQVFEEASSTALRAEKPAVTLALLQEALGAASPPATPAALYCLRRRALARERLNQLQEAKNDIRIAKTKAAELPDEHARRSMLGDLLATEGRILISEDPAASLARLTEAIQIYQGTDYPAQLALLYGARGRAYLAVGSGAPAENDFQQAIAAIQAQRSTVADAGLRASYLEEFRSIFDDMVDLQVRLGRKDRALECAESARAQVLRELLADARGEPIEATWTVRNLQKSLPASTAVVEYHMLPGKLLVWVIRKASLDLLQAEISPEMVRSLVEQFRRDILNRSSDLRRDANARRLYNLLIGRIRAAVPGVSTLVVVPDREIFSVPFAALPDSTSGQYLVERYALATAPSAAIFQRTLERERRVEDLSGASAMVIGDPAFDHSLLYAMPRLPHAEWEAIEVAAMHPKSRLVLGSEATRKSFLEALGRFDIIHFAGHAISNSASPLSAFLALAPAGGDSGLLYARDLYGVQRMKARLVVLSACSALAGDSPGAEGVENLARPFLAAGVPAVVASLWKVEDQPARMLFLEFYRRALTGASAVDALRQAQLAVLSGPDRFAGAPASWAGFQLIGAGY